MSSRGSSQITNPKRQTPNPKPQIPNSKSQIPKLALPPFRFYLGVWYRAYKDTIPRSRYLEWTSAWSALRPKGSLPTKRFRAARRTRPHPATFPPKLPEMCLRLHGLDRIRLVADPFLGLGSTAVACAQLGLNVVGFEMDEGYLTEAINRIRSLR